MNLKFELLIIARFICEQNVVVKWTNLWLKKFAIQLYQKDKNFLKYN